MSERVPNRDGDDAETELLRREVIYLLQSILGEVTVQAHGVPPTLQPAAREAAQAYNEMVARISMTAALPSDS